MRMPTIVLLLALLASPARAAEPTLDLDGWRLQQFATAVEGELGPPFKTITQPPWEHRAYRLGDDTYLVVGVREDQPSQIATLQITGAAVAMQPFYGLVLGDPRANVIAALGEPTETQPVESPAVSWLKYADRNYSVEIDAAGKLYSIRVGEAVAAESPDPSEDPWPTLKAAVLSGDFQRVLPLLRPDFEVFRGGETLSVGRRYSAFAAAPDGRIVAAFMARTGSVRASLERFEPEVLLRVTEEMGVGTVYRFAAPAPVEEIVLFPYDGAMRVWEVLFRSTESQPGVIELG